MSNMKKSQEALYQAYTTLMKRIGTVKANQWIKPIIVLCVDDNLVVTLGVKKGLAYKWVMNNYASNIKEYMIKYMPECSGVIFEAIEENQTTTKKKKPKSKAKKQEEVKENPAHNLPYEDQESLYANKELKVEKTQAQAQVISLDSSESAYDESALKKTFHRESSHSESAHHESAHNESPMQKADSRPTNYLSKEELKNLKYHEKPTQNIPSFKSKTPKAIVDDEKDSNKLFDKSDFRLNDRYQFESFVVGDPNKLAYELAKKTAEHEVPKSTLNPLFFYGGVGLGKTHLMTAIAHKYKANFPDKNVLYISTETFMYKFIEAQRKRINYDFKKELREVDMLLMDDIQFLVGKDHTEKEFLQAFKALDDQEKQIILSANSSPSDIKGLDDRIVSRINQGMVANIQSTDYALRLEIIKDKTKRLTDLKIPHKVMEFLAEKITNNVRELEGALKRIIQSAEITGQPINILTTEEVLDDILRSNNHTVTIKEINKHVALHFDIKISDLLSKSRVRKIATARHIAIYLSKQLTQNSQVAIGREFNRDHTTVTNSIKRIKKELESNGPIKESLRVLEDILK